MPTYESLLGIDPETGKKIPHLALSWSIEPSGQAVRFQLREGVQFHGDWGEFTAKDLLHQGADAARDDSLTGVSSFWRAALDKVEAINDYEAVYHLKRADGNFFDYVADQIGGHEINSRKHFDKVAPVTMQTGPIAGTGPYQLKERLEGQHVRFERTAYKHWRTTPDFPEFEFRFMREPSTRLATLLAGEAQLAALPQDLLEQASRSGSKVVKGRVPALRTYVSFVCCNFNDKADPAKGVIDPASPLNDLKVRRLLSKAINRDELNKGLFAGKGAPLSNNPFHTIRQGWNPDWERRFPAQYGYDQAAARALLAEAGYSPSNPLQVSMLLGPVPGITAADDVAEAIANYWRAVGVQVELVTIDPAQRTAQTRAGRLTRHATVSATNSNQWVGHYNFGTSMTRSSGVLGDTGPELWDAEQLMLQIAGTLDEKKIDGYWRQIGDILYDQHKYVPLFWLPVEVAVNPQIVADWVLPGSISGSWTHAENIKAAR